MARVVSPSPAEKCAVIWAVGCLRFAGGKPALSKRVFIRTRAPPLDIPADVQKFFGLSSYYLNFIRGFARTTLFSETTNGLAQAPIR
ncbi:hypothetical protein EBH_0040710 [Eimeria brunetti]|uniref:Uncharacterized protein n=1 Tax=Eimeria brunetti TaxID=51314 RepID=U6LM84_9EIME|nr:hypothetical protein EBH_0040710 [Eimeria brunetti]